MKKLSFVPWPGGVSTHDGLLTDSLQTLFHKCFSHKASMRAAKQDTTCQSFVTVCFLAKMEQNQTPERAIDLVEVCRPARFKGGV